MINSKREIINSGGHLVTLILCGFYLAENRVSPLTIAADLQAYGWNVNDHGRVSYLPVGDHDSYNWQWLPLDEREKIYGILKEKEKRQERIGVVLLWKESMIGGQLLINAEKISFIWTVNRKILQNGYRFTDVNWYLTRLISPLSKQTMIERLEWGETV